MSETNDKEVRTRVRKPDPETASEESITVTETPDSEPAGAEAEGNDEASGEASGFSFTLPLRAVGVSLFDAVGRQVAVCGISGDTYRTGPTIAKLLADAINVDTK